MTERVRLTLERTSVSQAQLARQIGTILGEHWDQPRVWKFLWNEVPATIRIWEACAQAINIHLVDLIGAPRLNVGYTNATITTEENAVLQRFRTDPLNRAINLSFLELAELNRRNLAFEVGMALGQQTSTEATKVTPAEVKTA